MVLISLWFGTWPLVKKWVFSLIFQTRDENTGAHRTHIETANERLEQQKTVRVEDFSSEDEILEAGEEAEEGDRY